MPSSSTTRCGGDSIGSSSSIVPNDSRKTKRRLKKLGLKLNIKKIMAGSTTRKVEVKVESPVIDVNL